MSRGRRRWLRWTVTALLLILVLRSVDVGRAADLLLAGSLPLAALAVAIFVLDRLVMAAKWYPLLHIQTPEVSPAAAVRAYFAASLAGTFLPTSVGSDVLRAVGLGRPRHKVAEIGVSIVLERLLGIAAACLLALVAIAVASTRSELTVLVPWAVLALVAAGVAGVAPFSRKLRSLPVALYQRFPGLPGKGALQRVDRAYTVYGRHRKVVLGVAAATLLEQLVPVLQFGVLSHALGSFPGIEALIVAVPLAMLISRLPVAVASLGVLEGSLVVLLGLYGTPAEVALALAFAYRIVILLAVLPGALFWSDLKLWREEAEDRSAPSPGGG